MPRVLIVDDSPTIRRLVRAVLESDPDLHVVGEARDGNQAIELCQALDPDVITMDIRMPGLDGYGAIRRIMASWPRPVIVLTSSQSDRELDIGTRALEAGALMVLGKPRGLPHTDPEAKRLIDQVKAMADVKVVRRTPWSGTEAVVVGSAPALSRHRWRRHGPPTIVGIGASTGGPPALHTLLSAGVAQVPVVVVQHISPGFVTSLARWLDQTTPWRVKVATPGELLQPRTVYLAPDDSHMAALNDGCVVLRAGLPVDGHCPSVTELFRSLAHGYGAAAVGVLLTGMGRDGAAGLESLHAAGGYTVAQDEATSVVYGMPKAAIEAGVVDEILSLPLIGGRLLEILTGRGSPAVTEAPGREVV